MPDSHRQLNRLQRIIDTQTAIVQSKLDLAGFMQLTVNTLQELTEARGAVIELVEGEWMVYRCGSGLMTEHVGLRLHRDGCCRRRDRNSPQEGHGGGKHQSTPSIYRPIDLSIYRSIEERPIKDTR